MFSCECIKLPVSHGGFKNPPLEGFNLERSQCNVLLIVLLQFGDNEAGEYFSFSSCLDWALYHTSQGVSPDTSLSRNKQSYYWVRQASDRKSMPGGFGNVLWQSVVHFRLSFFIVLWGMWLLFNFKCCHGDYRLTGGESQLAILWM